MNLLFLSRHLTGVCLVLLLGLSGPAIAEKKEAKLAVADSTEATTLESAKKGALTLAKGADIVDEPLYAGTSMWFLLSIAVLGSIAVQRRSDVRE